MKANEFYELIDKNILKDCRKIMLTKGEAYSGTEDKLGNFKRVAKFLGLTPKQVWAVYFHKHLDALSAYLRCEYKDSESIDERIKDLINYLLLLYGLIEEEKSGANK